MRAGRGARVFAVLDAAWAPVGVCLLLVCAMWLGLASHQEAAARVDLAAAQRTNAILARALGAHVERALHEVEDAMARFRSGARPAPYKAGHRLIHAIRRYDARGGFLASSDPNDVAEDMAPGFGGADRFADGDAGIHVSPPTRGREGRWTVEITWPLFEVGGFAGVLRAEVDAAELAGAEHGFDFDGGAYTLARSDGLRLAVAGDPRGAVGERSDALRALVDATPLSPCRTAPDTGTLYCGHVVSHDLVVIIATPQAVYLREQATQGRRLTLFASLLTLLAVPLAASTTLRRLNLNAARRDVWRSREAAARTARDLRYALDNMRHGLMLLDARGNVLVSNARALKLLGYDAAEPRPARVDALPARLAASGPAGEPLRRALRVVGGQWASLRGPDGRRLEIVTRQLPDGGYVRTIEDVTQRRADAVMLKRAATRAEAASRARGAFLARMSHEIRTPMHAVIGFARLLRSQARDATAARHAAHILAASEHLVAVVDDALDLAVLEAGRLELRPVEFDLRAMTERLRPIARQARGDRPIRFRLHVADDAPARVAADERRIFQVLTNFIGNAYKFTERGEVAVLVAPADEGGRALLRFEVRDTGVGLDAAGAAALFEPFARDPAAAERPGAGLGLAIVRQLVDLMDGRLDVSGRPGGGACFAALLPYERAERRESRKPAPRERPLSILLA
ncbi:MAG TPA: ATP-binding protein, partial [Beijerinckiaceae bacterium]